MQMKRVAMIWKVAVGRLGSQKMKRWSLILHWVSTFLFFAVALGCAETLNKNLVEIARSPSRTQIALQWKLHASCPVSSMGLRGIASTGPNQQFSAPFSLIDTSARMVLSM